MSTMCIDVRRVNDDYVCIYQAEHNHFSWPTHLPQSSWNDINEEDNDMKFYYNYFIIAKDEYYKGIEVIVYSSCDKNHTYKLLKDIYEKKEDAIFYNKCWYDYRIIRVPIYKYIPYTTKLSGGVWHGHRQKINKLGDEYRLYCPKDLNKKYKVYGTFGDRKKNGKGCYWTSPRKLR